MGGGGRSKKSKGGPTAGLKKSHTASPRERGGKKKNPDSTVAACFLIEIEGRAKRKKQKN